MRFIKSVLAGKTIVNQLMSSHGSGEATDVTCRAVNAGSESMRVMREFLCKPLRADARISEVVDTCCKIGVDTTDIDAPAPATMRMR